MDELGFYQKTENCKKRTKWNNQELKNGTVKIRNSVDILNKKLDTDGGRIKEVEDRKGEKIQMQRRERKL